MATLSLQQSNGAITFADQTPSAPASGQEAWEMLQYEKIMEIRDQVFAGSHPRLKLLHPVAPPNQDAPAVLSQPPSAPRDPGSSGIDPIFLTKSDVLLRAETQQKRQRLERVLAEQVKEKQASSKHKSFDLDDLPEFNVTEVLRKAQELVKPIKFTESSGANGNASASDSFDENTFYSSQMNDSTPELTDKFDPSQKPPRCHFFVRGEECPYGEHCKYPHGAVIPMEEQTLPTQVQADHYDNADTQAPPGASNAEQQPPANSSSSKNPNVNNTAPEPLSQAARIAQLEAELMALKGDQSDASGQSLAVNTSLAAEVQEEEIYSPPDAVLPNSREGPARNSGRRKNAQQQAETVAAGGRTKYQGARQRVKRNKAVQEEATSPIINEGRVVRNHITSPLAPQPARVSPLAVAKAPAIAQPQDEQGRGQVSNPKKRRREQEPEPTVRNVAARREPPSPEIRVKEEPMSPPPPRFIEAADRWEPRRRGNDRGPVYVDDVSPRFQDPENGMYRPNVIERPAARYVLDDYREAAPRMHEPELRRVVSTRQARAAPLAGSERYGSPQHPPGRAVSQMYLARQEQEIPRQFRASIQPEQPQYIDRDMAPSPRFREVSTMMAPPPRRIVVDQHGNQFYEQEVAPMPRPRQLSMAPLTRQGVPDQGYPMLGPRHSVARIPQASEKMDENRYVRGGPTPPSPQYVEYNSPIDIRQPVPREGETYYSNAPQPRYGENVRIVDYGPQTHGRYEELRPVESISRVSSVRPVGARYEGGSERVTRVQSVLPEGRRVVSLGSEMMPQGTRHMSIRPDDPYVRPVEYAPARTQYYPGPDGRG
ncbi:MAG: hypothetical protein Q9168_005751 [Polycauliona sp. 1 TL-2023]